MVRRDSTATLSLGAALPWWLQGFIRDPSHPRSYGDRNDRMPAFGPDEILSEVEIGLLVGWLRGEW